MQYQILIEHPNQNGFVASVIGVPDCVVTANTEQDAIASVRQALQARLSQAKIVAIEVESPLPQRIENPFSVAALKDDPTFDDLMEKLQQIRRQGNAQSFDDELEPEEAVEKILSPPENPLLKFAGHLKDDPHFDEMMDEIKKYRRETDAQDQPATMQLEDTSGKKPTGNPWRDSFGVLKDDPTFDDLMEKLERYRREGNADITEQEA